MKHVLMKLKDLDYISFQISFSNVSYRVCYELLHIITLFKQKALFLMCRFSLTTTFEINFPVASYFEFKKQMRLRSYITIGENYFFCY